jgi:hypothetical protein
VECNNSLRIHKTWADMSLHLAVKFSVEQPPVADELDNIAVKKLGCMEYKLNKLDSDRFISPKVYRHGHRVLSLA